MLEPQQYAARYAVYALRRAGGAWDDWLAERPGIDALSREESERVNGMSASVRSTASLYLGGGTAEVERAWRIGDRGCRGRIDYVHPTLGVIELKTCADASPEAFARESWRYMYHGQLAWYCDGLGLGDLDATIIAVEKDAPYAVSIYRVGPELLHEGRALYKKLLARLDECEKSDTWPGYIAHEQPLGIPPWARLDGDENDLEDII